MSSISSLSSGKGDKQKKFLAVNINNVYKGKGIDTQKAANAPRHGFQSLGKVAPTRRVPPPALLPSLKAENSGNDPTISLVPSGGAGSGWGSKQQTMSPSTSSAALNAEGQQQSQQLILPGRTSSPNITGSASINRQGTSGGTASSTVGKTWSSVTGRGMTAEPEQRPPPPALAGGKENQRFAREFPTLDGAVTGADANRNAVKSTAATDLDLRPQNVGSWREGGGRIMTSDQRDTVSVNSEQGTESQYRPVSSGLFNGRPAPSYRRENVGQDDLFKRPPIIKDKDLEEFGQKNKSGTEETSWATVTGDIDYNVKLVFSDEEDESNERRREKDNRSTPTDDTRQVKNQRESSQERPRPQSVGAGGQRFQQMPPKQGQPRAAWPPYGPAPYAAMLAQQSIQYEMWQRANAGKMGSMPSHMVPVPGSYSMMAPYRMPPFAPPMSRPPPQQRDDEDELWRRKQQQTHNEVNEAVERAKSKRAGPSSPGEAESARSRSTSESSSEQTASRSRLENKHPLPPRFQLHRESDREECSRGSSDIAKLPSETQRGGSSPQGMPGRQGPWPMGWAVPPPWMPPGMPPMPPMPATPFVRNNRGSEDQDHRTPEMMDMLEYQYRMQQWMQALWREYARANPDAQLPPFVNMPLERRDENRSKPIEQEVPEQTPKPANAAGTQSVAKENTASTRISRSSESDDKTPTKVQSDPFAEEGDTGKADGMGKPTHESSSRKEDRKNERPPRLNKDTSQREGRGAPYREGQARDNQDDSSRESQEESHRDAPRRDNHVPAKGYKTTSRREAHLRENEGQLSKENQDGVFKEPLARPQHRDTLSWGDENKRDGLKRRSEVSAPPPIVKETIKHDGERASHMVTLRRGGRTSVESQPRAPYDTKLAVSKPPSTGADVKVQEPRAEIGVQTKIGDSNAKPEVTQVPDSSSKQSAWQSLPTSEPALPSKTEPEILNKKDEPSPVASEKENKAPSVIAGAERGESAKNVAQVGERSKISPALSDEKVPPIKRYREDRQPYGRASRDSHGAHDEWYDGQDSSRGVRPAYAIDSSRNTRGSRSREFVRGGSRGRFVGSRGRNPSRGSYRGFEGDSRPEYVQSIRVENWDGGSADLSGGGENKRFDQKNGVRSGVKESERSADSKLTPKPISTRVDTKTTESKAGEARPSEQQSKPALPLYKPSADKPTSIIEEPKIKEGVRLTEAPPPKENIWDKRKQELIQRDTPSPDLTEGHEVSISLKNEVKPAAEQGKESSGAKLELSAQFPVNDQELTYSDTSRGRGKGSERGGRDSTRGRPRGTYVAGRARTRGGLRQQANAHEDWNYTEVEEAAIGNAGIASNDTRKPPYDDTRKPPYDDSRKPPYDDTRKQMREGRHGNERTRDDKASYDRQSHGQTSFNRAPRRGGRAQSRGSRRHGASEAYRTHGPFSGDGQPSIDQWHGPPSESDTAMQASQQGASLHGDRERYPNSTGHSHRGSRSRTHRVPRSGRGGRGRDRLPVLPSAPLSPSKRRQDSVTGTDPADQEEWETASESSDLLKDSTTASFTSPPQFTESGTSAAGKSSAELSSQFNGFTTHRGGRPARSHYERGRGRGATRGANSRHTDSYNKERSPDGKRRPLTNGKPTTDGSGLAYRIHEMTFDNPTAISAALSSKNCDLSDVSKPLPDVGKPQSAKESRKEKRELIVEPVDPLAGIDMSNIAGVVIIDDLAGQEDSDGWQDEEGFQEVRSRKARKEDKVRGQQLQMQERADSALASQQNVHASSCSTKPSNKTQAAAVSGDKASPRSQKSKLPPRLAKQKEEKLKQDRFKIDRWTDMAAGGRQQRVGSSRRPTPDGKDAELHTTHAAPVETPLSIGTWEQHIAAPLATKGEKVDRQDHADSGIDVSNNESGSVRSSPDAQIGPTQQSKIVNKHLEQPTKMDAKPAEFVGQQEFISAATPVSRTLASLSTGKGKERSAVDMSATLSADGADLKLDFTFDPELTGLSELNAIPSSRQPLTRIANDSRTAPSSATNAAADLNLKLDSVKTLWDSPTTPTVQPAASQQSLYQSSDASRYSQSDPARYSQTSQQSDNARFSRAPQPDTSRFPPASQPDSSRYAQTTQNDSARYSQAPSTDSSRFPISTSTTETFPQDDTASTGDMFTTHSASDTSVIGSSRAQISPAKSQRMASPNGRRSADTNTTSQSVLDGSASAFTPQSFSPFRLPPNVQQVSQSYNYIPVMTQQEAYSQQYRPAMHNTFQTQLSQTAFQPGMMVSTSNIMSTTPVKPAFANTYHAKVGQFDASNTAQPGAPMFVPYDRQGVMGNHVSGGQQAVIGSAGQQFRIPQQQAASGPQAGSPFYQNAQAPTPQLGFFQATPMNTTALQQTGSPFGIMQITPGPWGQPAPSAPTIKQFQGNVRPQSQHMQQLQPQSQSFQMASGTPNTAFGVQQTSGLSDFTISQSKSWSTGQQEQSTISQMGQLLSHQNLHQQHQQHGVVNKPGFPQQIMSSVQQMPVRLQSPGQNQHPQTHTPTSTQPRMGIPMAQQQPSNLTRYPGPIQRPQQNRAPRTTKAQAGASNSASYRSAGAAAGGDASKYTSEEDRRRMREEAVQAAKSFCNPEGKTNSSQVISATSPGVLSVPLQLSSSPSPPMPQQSSSSAVALQPGLSHPDETRSEALEEQRGSPIE